MTVDELAERGIRVKPLEWDDGIAGTIWLSNGDYSIFAPARTFILRNDELQAVSEHPTLEAAKAAAEADHAARVAAQLECSREACEGPEVTG